MDALSVITLVVALLPTVVIMAIVISNARFKREPVKKIASVFAISAISTIPAAIAEGIGSTLLSAAMGIFSIEEEGLNADTSELLIYYLLNFMLVVGLAEEACKFITFKWIIFHDRDFDNTYDGVIYGAASALGFATLENLMYVFMYGEVQLETAALRAVLSVPMHAFTGIVMGYWFGITKYRKYNNVQTNSKPEIKALIFSVILHGTYDFIATLSAIYYESKFMEALSWVLLAAVMIFIYITMWRTISNAKKETYNIYNRYYYEHLNGHFQDMIGGKTSDRRYFLGMPLPVFYGARQGFDPYNPYAGMNVPPPNMQGNQMYTYGSQQPYNPYYNTQYPPTPYTSYPPETPNLLQKPENPNPPANSPSPSYIQYTAPTPDTLLSDPGLTADPASDDCKVCPNCANIQRGDTNYCSKCGSRLEF